MGKHQRVTLTDDDRAALTQLVRAGHHDARFLTRARILLLTDHGNPARQRDTEVARSLFVSTGTVGNVRRRYAEHGLDAALHDKPRPGAAPKITGEVEAHLIALACSTPPEGRTRWTVRLLADELVRLELVADVAHSTVWERMKKTTSSPGRSSPGASPRPVGAS